MAKHLFSDNASSLLAASIDDNDLTIQVQNGFGALFPNPGAGEDFYVTLENDSGDIEIVRIESRSTDLLTVATGGRGQAGTSAQSWTNGQARVELRLNSAIMESFIQRGGDTMEGDLDLDDNELQNADIQDSTFEGGEIVNTPIRGTSGDSSNQIVVPTDGTRATAGGQRILTENDSDEIIAAAFTTGMIMMWFGAAVDCPDGWAICDGTGGTPDLRDRVPIGAGTSYALNASGGAASATPTINAGGDHSHGGVTGETTLDEDQIPEHSHRLFVWDSGSNGPGQMENFGSSTLGNAKGVAGNADSNTYAYRQATQAGNDLIEAAGGGENAGHDHSIAASGTHTHTAGSVSTLPPYRALYFIMKT